MNLEIYKNKLESEEVRLSKEIAFIESEDPYKDANRAREVQDDTITEIEEHDRLYATQSQLEIDLKLVKQALERIKKGTYGVCSNCHKPIGDERLAVMPTASLCASCQADKNRA